MCRYDAADSVAAGVCAVVNTNDGGIVVIMAMCGNAMVVAGTTAAASATVIDTCECWCVCGLLRCRY